MYLQDELLILFFPPEPDKKNLGAGVPNVESCPSYNKIWNFEAGRDKYSFINYIYLLIVWLIELFITENRICLNIITRPAVMSHLLSLLVATIY